MKQIIFALMFLASIAAQAGQYSYTCTSKTNGPVFDHGDSSEISVFVNQCETGTYLSVANNASTTFFSLNRTLKTGQYFFMNDDSGTRGAMDLGAFLAPGLISGKSSGNLSLQRSLSDGSFLLQSYSCQLQ